MPMIRTALMLALGASAAAGSVLAQESVTRDVDIRLTTVTPPLCKVTLVDRAAVAITGSMVDETGPTIGQLRRDIGELGVSVNAWCNTSSLMAVQADAMIGPALIDQSSTTRFARAVNFRARSLGWTADAAAPFAITAADRLGGGQVEVTGTPVAIDGPRDDSLRVRFDQFSAANGAVLVSGDYAGSVTITLSPR